MTPTTFPCRAVFTGETKNPRSGANLRFGQTGEAQVSPGRREFVIFVPDGAPEKATYVVPEDLYVQET